MTRLTDDLRAEFPSMRGFSRANLFYMSKCSEVWSDEAAIVQQPIGQLPWSHITVPTNFSTALEAVDSELAQQITKDPFTLDFLAIGVDTTERDLEERLTARIVDTLRELGAGFAFVGRQVHFEVDGDDFCVDLLFFHVEQFRYIVIELKTTKFEPRDASQLGF